MELEARIRRVERRNSVLAGALLVALLGLALGSVPGPDPVEEIVRCGGVEIVGADGAVVARLGVNEAGAVGLFVNDGDGRLRVSVTHEAEQSALFIRDDQGDVRVGVAQFSHGGGGVALHGPEARGAAVLYYKDGGSVTFYRADGSTELRLSGGKD